LQLRNPTHPNLSAPAAIHSLSNLLKKTSVRTLFVQADGVTLLIPLISPASTQQSTQVIAETINHISGSIMQISLRRYASFRWIIGSSVAYYKHNHYLLGLLLMCTSLFLVFVSYAVSLRNLPLHLAFVVL
jgi:hypothetical protein